MALSARMQIFGRSSVLPDCLLPGRPCARVQLESRALGGVVEASRSVKRIFYYSIASEVLLIASCNAFKKKNCRR